MATNKPDLTRIWAGEAPNTEVIDPDTTTSGKVASGWRAEIPPYEHFNFLQKWFSQGLAHMNEQGISEWDSETTYPLHGLAKGSDGEVYKSLSEQKGNDPTSDTENTYWVPFVSSTTEILNLKEAYALSNGDNITSALVDAVTKSKTITLGGLKNVVIDPSTNLSVDRICTKIKWDGATVTCVGSQILLADIDDSLSLTLELDSGQFWGDGKYVEIAENTGVNTDTIIVKSGSSFVVGDRVTSSFDNKYLANSSSRYTVNTLANITSNGDGTDTWTLDFPFCRRPNGEYTGNAVFTNIGYALTVALVDFPVASRVEVGQKLIITGTQYNNITTAVNDVQVNGGTVTFITEERLLNETTTATIDFRGDGEIPAGSYALTADFQRNGLMYYGSGDFTITANTNNELPVRKWRGYISSCVDYGAVGREEEKRGTFTIEGVDWGDAFLDCWKIAKDKVNIKNTKAIGSKDVGKQGVLLDLNKDSLTVVEGNYLDRKNKDLDFLWYPMSNENVVVQTGSVVVRNNTFRSSIADLPFAGDTVWGRSKLKFDTGALHTFSAFFTAGVIGGVFESKGNIVTDYARAFFSSSRVSKDNFTWDNISSENDNMECDFSFIQEVGVTETAASRKRQITVTNSRIGGSQETLNIGSTTTYYNCEVFSTRAMRDIIFVDTTGIKYSIFNGGRLDGRFRFTGNLNKITNLRLPYAPEQDPTYQIPLFGSAYMNEGLNLILETPDINLGGYEGYTDLVNWFGVNITANDPAAPNITFKFERDLATCTYGNRGFTGGIFTAELPSESLEQPPYNLVGSTLKYLPVGSTIRGLSDNTLLECIKTRVGGLGDIIVGDEVPVTSFTVSAPVPYGTTHVSLIRKLSLQEQNNTQFIYTIEPSSWGTTTVTLKPLGRNSIGYVVLPSEDVMYYTFVDRTQGHTAKVYVDPAETTYGVTLIERGVDFIHTGVGVLSFQLRDDIEDGSEIGVRSLGAGTNTILPPSGWSLALNGGTSSFTNATLVADRTNQVIYVKQ